MKELTKVTESALLDVTAYEDIAKGLLDQAQRAEITDVESYTKGGDLAKVAAQQVKAIEERRTGIVKPINAVVKVINDAFKPAKSDLEEVRRVMQNKMLGWKKEEDRKRAEEARKQREALEAAALERAEHAGEEDADAILDAAAEASENMPTSVGTAHGNYGTASTTKKYETEITHLVDFVQFLVSEARCERIELGGIIDFRKAGMNKLAKQYRERGIEEVRGAKFVEKDGLRIS